MLLCLAFRCSRFLLVFEAACCNYLQYLVGSGEEEGRPRGLMIREPERPAWEKGLSYRSASL